MLTSIEDLGDPILNILVVVYWVFVASYIEEWFWRNYYHFVLFSNRIFDRLWKAFTWGTMYVVLVFLNADIMSALIAFGVLGVIGYILDPIIRWEWGSNSMLFCHIGCNLGIGVCWYLAGQGMFLSLIHI